MITKQCSRCSEVRPVEQFQKNKRYKDGYASWCKPCMKEYQSRWIEEHKDEVSEKRRTWENANKERVRETQKRYYYRNQERKRAARRAYYWQNREQQKAKALIWSRGVPAGVKRKHVRLSTERHPERAKARNAVTWRKESGRLPKASSLPCVCCQQPARHYHHFKSYSAEDRLAVVPVCLSCHGMLHAGMLVLVKNATTGRIASA